MIYQRNDEKLKDANLDLKTKQDLFQCDPSSYNGAKRDNYSWTQSIKDIDVRVNVRDQLYIKLVKKFMRIVVF